MGIWDNYRKIIESIKSTRQRPTRRVNSKAVMLGESQQKQDNERRGEAKQVERKWGRGLQRNK